MQKLNCVSTVVGSFPYSNTPENMEKAFWDQINAGIDYPCYPQLNSMIDQFLDPLCELNSNLVKQGQNFVLEKDLVIPKSPYALEYGKFVTDFFAKNPTAKPKVKGWKACLTGPFTLAGSIITTAQMVNNQNPIIFKEPRAIMSADLLYKIADMMAIIAKAYDDMGATIISMDEPSLSLIVGLRKIFYHKEDVIIDVLNRALKPISKYSSIHICGRLSPKLRDILLSSNVKILDHEFTNGDNDAVFNKSHFENNDKSLAYGALQSSVKYIEGGKVEDYIETPAIIDARLQKSIAQIGKENLIFKPDCGFGGLMATFGPELAPEIVRRKLTLLNEGIKRLK